MVPDLNMGGFICLFYRLKPCTIRPLTAYFYRPFKRRYSDTIKSYTDEDHVIDDKAPTLAAEFKKIQKEKEEAERLARLGDQGAPSQNSEKAFEAADEAIYNDVDLEVVKRKYKGRSEKDNYNKY